LQYFVEAGAMAVRRVKKEDMRRIAKATGGTMVRTLNLVWLDGPWGKRTWLVKMYRLTSGLAY
jgi:hypothetical protein